MNRTIGVMAGLLLALGASACVSDPSLEFAADPNQIAADPDAMFVTYGVQKQVLVRYVDDRNRATAAKFEITNVGPGITVTLDNQYRMDMIETETLRFREVQLQHRYFVNTTEAAAAGLQTSFTVNTGGVSRTIPVRVLPANLATGLSSTTPALGEPVTITAPANLSFSPDASEVTLLNGSVSSTVVIQERTAKSITFVPRPGTSGVVRVTNVLMDYAPTVSGRTLATTNSVTVPAITSTPTISTTAPGLGDQFTVTAGPGMAFTSASTVTFTPGGAAVVVSQTPTTMTLLGRPGSTGAATVTGMVLTELQGGVLGTFARTSGNAITTPIPAVASITGTFSDPAPAVGTEVTFSAPGFKFLPNVTMSFGTRRAAITAVSADSSTITVLPPVGVSGSPTITNSVLDFLTAVPLSAIPTTGTLTTPGSYVAPKLTNAEVASVDDDPPDAAPVLAAGNGGAGLFDGGAWTGADWFDEGGPNRIYRIVVTGATRTRSVSVDWQGDDADIDFFMTNNAITAFVGTQFGSATGNQPENQNVSLAEGSYWVFVVNWHHFADPDWVYAVVQ